MKNTLAENLLRFGVKNLSKSEISKLEEQNTPKTVNFYEEFPNLQIGKLQPYPAFTTPKLLYRDARGEANVSWDKSNVMKLNNSMALILGNRMNPAGQYLPTISLTQPDGIEVYTMAANTSDLKSLLEKLLSMNAIASEVDYSNIFKSLRGYLPNYIKMNTKADLDTLSAKNPTYKTKVDAVANALGIVS